MADHLAMPASSTPPATPRTLPATAKLPTRSATVTRSQAQATMPVLRRAHTPQQLELDLRRSV
jgi:hypothetical protein